MAEHVKKCVPFGSPATKPLTPALAFPAAYAQGSMEGNEGASKRGISEKSEPWELCLPPGQPVPEFHSLSLPGASDSSALGFQEPKDDPVGPTGQENNDDAAIYGLLSTS